jgi:hypothetical protein
LEAKIIKNNGTSSIPDNVEDSNYTRFDSLSGAVYLPFGQVMRDFRIVFDSSSPTVFSIDWGSYTRTVASTTVCNPMIWKKTSFINGSEVTSTGQTVFVNNMTDALSTALLNDSGSIVQSEFVCPQDILDLNVPGLSWTSWGFSKHISLIDFDIDIKPF